MNTVSNRAKPSPVPTRIRQRLIELLRVPSFTGEEGDAVALLAGWLAALPGVSVDHWEQPIAELESHPNYPGREVERTMVPGVAALLRGRRPGPRRVLTGHVDVVPVGAGWTRAPFGAEVEGERIFGRGACDMKGGVISALEAFTVVAEAHRLGVDAAADFAGELLFVGVSGEEDGGCGTLSAIVRGWTGDEVVIAEPTHQRGVPTIVIAHGGALTYTLTVAGRSAHASKRLEGESALDHFWTLCDAMRRGEMELNAAETEPVMRALGLPYPTSIGRVQGGEWSSSVMDKLWAEVRVGVSIHETIGEADARFRQTVLGACQGSPWLMAHSPGIERTGAAFASAHLSPTDPLVHSLAAAAASEWTSSVELAGAPYGCDMALWLRAGGASTVVFGPGDVALAHAPDEWVSLREVEEVARVLVRWVLGES